MLYMKIHTKNMSRGSIYKKTYSCSESVTMLRYANESRFYYGPVTFDLYFKRLEAR